MKTATPETPTSTATAIELVRKTMSNLFNGGEFTTLDQLPFLLRIAELEERAELNRLLKCLLDDTKFEPGETSTAKVLELAPKVMEALESNGSLPIEKKMDLLLAIAHLEEVALTTKRY